MALTTYEILQARYKELEAENAALRHDVTRLMAAVVNERNDALEEAARLYDGNEWIGCNESIIAAEIRALKDQQGQRSEAAASGTPKLLDASVQSSGHPTKEANPQPEPAAEVTYSNWVERQAVSEELMPIQKSRPYGAGAFVPKVVYMRAYEVYAHLYGPQEAMLNGHCRGGFGVGELTAFLYAASFPRKDWRDRFDEALRGMKL